MSLRREARVPADLSSAQQLAAIAVADTICSMDAPRSTSTRLTVSIVLFHSPLALVKQTVLSLQSAAASALEAQLVVEVHLTVIDNSMCDQYYRDVCRELQAWLDDSPLVWRCQQAPFNGGYGAGHNLAMVGIDSDYHLILNPDVELDASALSVGLARLVEDATQVLQSPQVHAEDGRQEFLCKSYPTVLVLLLRAFAPASLQALFRRQLDEYEMRDQCSGQEEVEVTLASGCFMLVRTSVLRTVSGFNDDYFLYFEDFDLSMRLAARGRLVFNPAMRIRHHGGYAARKGHRHLRYFVRSGIRFFNDYGWRWI